MNREELLKLYDSNLEELILKAEKIIKRNSKVRIKSRN